MTHDLKTWPAYFEAMRDGRKTFEVRKADRQFSVGDVLNLHEWDPETEHHTGRTIQRRVTFVCGLGGIIGAAFVGMSIIPYLPGEDK